MSEPKADRSPLYDRLAEEKKIHRDRNTKSSGEAPGEMPEIHREITMLQGMVEALTKGITSFVARMEPVMLPQMKDQNNPNPIGGPEVVTDLGRALREITNRFAEMEELLRVSEYHIAL